MKIAEFAKELTEKCVAIGMDLEVTTVTKNNGVHKIGIRSSNATNGVSPVIYIEGLHRQWEEEHNWEIVVKEMEEAFQSKRNLNFDLQEFLNYERVKDRLMLKLIGYEKNSELLKDIPYQRVLDLALVCVLLVSQDDTENATILIHNNHLDSWNITKEELFQDAGISAPKISPAKIQTMQSILSEMYGEEIPLGDDAYDSDEQMPMYVISNQQKFLGASVLC